MHQDAFKALKTTFSQAPVLIHFNPNNLIIVKTDASDYAIATILSQITPSDGDIHPVTFYSHGLALVEMNYKIYDKELLVIFGAFKQWQNYLEGAVHTILVLSNHKNLEYITTTKQLTRCQVWWSEYLSGFNYIICYRTR